jgi:hypothetical protein
MLAIKAVLGNEFMEQSRLERLEQDIKKNTMSVDGIANKYKEISGHGVDQVTLENVKSGKRIVLDFINAGDMYSATIMENPITNKLVISDYATMLETLEKKGYEPQEGSDY